MRDGVYRPRPLSPAEREEMEADLVAFCDRELDRLGSIEGLDVLYAGGASVLWLEGLSGRIGAGGSLTALEVDRERLETARATLPEAELAAPVRLARGSVFDPPFPEGSFDLVYSAGLFHELDVREGSAPEALRALARVVRPGGRVAASDFVNRGESPGPVALEDERLDGEEARLRTGAEPWGVGPPERLVELFGGCLRDVRWAVAEPVEIRHLGRIVAEGRAGLRRRIAREGYTRPATLYVEGKRP